MIVTPTMLTALFTGFKKQFEDAKSKASSRWELVATRVPSSTRSNTYGWLGQFPQMREWYGDRVVKDMAAQSYAIENRKFESTVGIERVDIEDDNLGIYSPMIAEMGYAATVYPDELVFPLLAAGDSSACYDGQNFFDADHPVYASVDGTGAATSVSNLGGGSGPSWYLLDTRRVLKPLIFQERQAPEFTQQTNPNTSDSVFMTDAFKFGVRARSNVGFGFWQQAYMSKEALDTAAFNDAFTAMMRFKADGGRPLGLRPNLLVVPPELRASAMTLIEAQLTGGGNSNPNYKAVDLEVVEWL